MAIKTILALPDERLRLPSIDVTDVAAAQTVIEDLLDTLYHTTDGIGLAAPQIGAREAIVVIDVSEDRDQPLVLINPKIVSKARPVIGQEGCLSVPGYYADVTRYEEITLEALDRHGAPIKMTRDDFVAIVIQHELDHLAGIVFIDYLSPLKQKMALKKIKKALAGQ